MTLTEFQGLSALLITTLAILVHHYGFSVEALQRHWGDSDASISAHVHRGLGFVVLGLIPLLLSIPLGIFDVGVGMRQPGTVLFVTTSLSLIAGAVVWSAPANESLLADYPMVRKEHWTTGTYVASVVSWVLFLLGYEFMYRGFLLFTLLDGVGPYFAIAVTTALYVLHHLPKAGDEAFGSVVFGVVLGCLAVWSGGFWPAFILHTVVAVVGEFNFLRAHPVIRG